MTDLHIRSPWKPMWIRWLLSFFAFLVLGIMYTYPAIAHFHSAVIGDGGDSPGMLWQLAWVRGWLEGVHPLYYTHAVLFPFGANLAWSALDLPLTIPGAAFIPWFGLVGTYNILVWVALALNAWTASLLCYRITRNFFASIIGGAVFGFSAYTLGQTLSHLNLVTSFGLPLVVIAWLQIADSPLPTRRNILRNGIFLGFAVAVATYSTYDYGIYALELLLLLLLLTKKWSGSQWKSLFTAAITFLVIMAPTLAALLIGQGAVAPAGKFLPGLHTPFVVDLFGYFSPSPINTILGSRVWSGIPFTLSPNFGEGPPFLGYLPLISLGYQWWKRRLALSKPWFIVMWVFAVLSLGPLLHINGVASGVLLPEWVLQAIPFINVTLPSRFAVIVMLMAAIISAQALENFFSTLDSGLARSVAASIGVALIVVSTWTAPYVITVFKKSALDNVLASRGGVVLEVPVVVPWTGIGVGPTGYLFDQAAERMRYTLVEGYESRLPQHVINYFGSQPTLIAIYLYQQHLTVPQNILLEAKSQAHYFLWFEHIRTIAVRSAYLANFSATARFVQSLFGARLSHIGSNAYIKIGHISPIRNQPLTPVAYGPGSLMLTNGWSYLEQSTTQSWRWSNGLSSAVKVPVFTGFKTTLQMIVSPFSYPHAPPLKVSVYYHKESIGAFTLTRGQAKVPLAIKLPKSNVTGFATVRLVYSWDAIPARVLTGSTDSRALSIKDEEIGWTTSR